ncbi:MAG: energy-coupling factor transporter transmembrane protein EcfT [Oscillospiraceae bacterium]|nr:energy-coupling factor transporter transmembrane protein EcfT [Oscillospiraceae bacterium]
MNNRLLINYTPGTTPIHRLNGATKVMGFIVVTVYIIMTFDARIMLPMFLLCTAGVISMRPNWKPILLIMGFMFIMAGVIGSMMIILIRPSSGLTHVGGETVIVRWTDHFFISRELLWYVGAMYFKRLCSLSTAILFILAITPSELAAGFNKIGMPYKICTVLSLAFRTIPDIARDYIDIKNSLMMRGVELDSRKVGLVARLKQTVFILSPLIMTSFGRIGTIANAMDLRGFSKLKRRSWYSEREPTRADWIARGIIVLVAIFVIYYIVFVRVLNPPPFSYWSPWGYW